MLKHGFHIFRLLSILCFLGVFSHFPTLAQSCSPPPTTKFVCGVDGVNNSGIRVPGNGTSVTMNYNASTGTGQLVIYQINPHWFILGGQGNCTNASWITLGSSGITPQQVFILNFTVAPNNGTCRSGRIYVTLAVQFFAGSATGVFTADALIVQDGTQNFSFSPPSVTVSSAIVGDATAIITSGPCSYTRTNNVPWITTPTGGFPIANGLRYGVTQNTTKRPRTGTITLTKGNISGTFTVNQLRNPDTVGVFRPSTSTFYLRNQNNTGNANIEFPLGFGADIPIVGDWDGNGTRTAGVFRNGEFLLRNSNSAGNADLDFIFGTTGDIPIVGDWDGNGTDTIGVYRPSTNQFLLRNSNSAGPAEIDVTYGASGDIPVAGDWNNDGIDTIGIFRPSTAHFLLRNSNTTGFAEIDAVYGLGTDIPIIGDWNGDGTDTIGVFRPSTGQFLLRNSNTTGNAHLQFNYGIENDIPLVGDWDAQP